jgi:hypothetical protein
MNQVCWDYTARVPLPRQSVDTACPPEDPMLTTATVEVMRLVSTVVRRIDEALVRSAVLNAEASVLATHERWLDEMATLSDLYALQGLAGEVEPVPEPVPATVPATPMPELVGV